MENAMSEAASTIAVIDDEEVIRFALQKKLARMGYNVLSLEKAEDFLYLMKDAETRIDLVITDIKLRKMDGIELLRRIKAMEKPMPVLIITGHGNVEEAITALRLGANDFIRKPFDINDVASSVRAIVRGIQEKELEENFARFADYQKTVYSIPVDSALINTISYRLTRDLVPSGLCNYTTAENVSLALREAISNAMFHGNLEISSELREEGGIKRFNEEIELRKAEPEFEGRMVKLACEITRDYAEYVIEDEGRGFDVAGLPDPRDPENFFKNSGRGILIIRIHMDEVSWNEKGNIITMRKYRIPVKKEAPVSL